MFSEIWIHCHYLLTDPRIYLFILLFQEISHEREIANRLLHRLMDVAYETFKEMGGSNVELQEIQKKRSYIQTCYFQAISCYWKHWADMYS